MELSRSEFGLGSSHKRGSDRRHVTKIVGSCCHTGAFFVLAGVISQTARLVLASAWET